MNSQVKTLSGVKPLFFRVMKLSTKSARHYICTPKPQKNGGIGAVLEDEVGKMCTRLSREFDFLKKWKNAYARSSAASHWQRCAKVAWFGAILLLCVFATGCNKTYWHGCAQQSISDAATLLLFGIAAGGLQRHRNSCAEGSFWAPSILVLGGITAERGSCKVHFNSCVKRRIGLPTEEVTEAA